MSCAGCEFVPQIHFNQQVHIFRSLQGAKAAATKFNNIAGTKLFKVVVVRYEVCEDDPQAIYDRAYTEVS